MQRIIRTLHATLSDGREVLQGDQVDLDEQDEVRLDEQKALVPKDFGSYDEFERHVQDVYRGGRGDITAAGRLGEARSGGIIDLSPEGERSQAESFIAYLEAEKPNIDEVISKVDGNPNLAAAMLEAERAVTGGDPRKSLAKTLEGIIQGG